MKKLDGILLSCALCAAVLTSCSSQEAGTDTTVDSSSPATSEGTTQDSTSEDTEVPGGTLAISHIMGDIEVPLNPSKIAVFDMAVLEL